MADQPDARVVGTLMLMAAQMLGTAHDASKRAYPEGRTVTDGASFVLGSFVDTKTLVHLGSAMGTLSFLVYRYLDMQSTLRSTSFKVFTEAFDAARQAASEVPLMFPPDREPEPVEPDDG